MGTSIPYFLEQVRLNLNSFPIKRHLDARKERLLQEQRAESRLTNRDPHISQVCIRQRLRGLRADGGVSMDLKQLNRNFTTSTFITQTPKKKNRIGS